MSSAACSHLKAQRPISSSKQCLDTAVYPHAAPVKQRASSFFSSSAARLQCLSVFVLGLTAVQRIVDPPHFQRSRLVLICLVQEIPVPFLENNPISSDFHFMPCCRAQLLGQAAAIQSEDNCWMLSLVSHELW